MKNDRNDIEDDEIRIIKSKKIIRIPRSDRHPRRLVWAVITVGVIIMAAVIAALTRCAGYATSGPGEEVVDVVAAESTDDADQMAINHITQTYRAQTQSDAARGYVTANDTVVNGGVRLTLLTPVGAVPVLEIGSQAISDSTAVLVAQAADVRGDNGAILGTFVMRGQLMGKGESKAGFCSIINGTVSVGVADATPMLEQAIETDGYFFRQYPLVVGGQVVENKPRGRSLRKALAELEDGSIAVIISGQKLTFHEFSEALTAAGVRNAIYLVGSAACATYLDREGVLHTFGSFSESRYDNINYLVWR